MTKRGFSPVIFYSGASPKEAFEIVYGDNFLLHAAALLGVPNTPDAISSLRDVLTGVAAAYSEGAHLRLNAKSEKAQNAALEKVADKAEDLYTALMGLFEFGGCEERLLEEIMRYSYTPGSSTDMLQKLMPLDKGNPIMRLRDLITDVAVAAEDAMTRETSRRPGIDLAAVIVKADGLPESEYPRLRAKFDEEDRPSNERKNQERRERAAKHRISKDHALKLMLTELGACWPELSDRPFTEGMHHADQGTTVSLAVDLVEMMLAELDPKVPRSQITTTLRKVRKSMNLDQDHR